MLKSTPKKKKSLGFASSSPSSGRDFNPGRFLSGLTPAHYPKGFHPSVKAINKSIELVDWLIKKHSDDAAAMDLADRLDNCQRKKRAGQPPAPAAPLLPRRSPPRSRSSFSPPTQIGPRLFASAWCRATERSPLDSSTLINTLATPAVGKKPSVELV
jgi:hypothetical protein